MKQPAFLRGISFKGIHGHRWKEFFRDLNKEIGEDNVFNGAAALGYYLTLAIFPAMIFLLSLLPHLPIPNLQGEILGLLNQFLPKEAVKMLSTTVQEIVSNDSNLLSIGAALTLWAAASGMYAIMQQLNITYDIKEGRSFLKARSISLVLTIGFGALVVGSFLMIVLGQALEDWLSNHMAWSQPLLVGFSLLRWIVIPVALSLAFALIYYLGPDVEQKFVFITPGSIMAMVLIVAVSVGFKVYVENFGNYNATYGSIGAVIILMLWLNFLGLVILLGSEMNALVEHYDPLGKSKGEKTEGPSMQKEERRGIMESGNLPHNEAESHSYGFVARELGARVKDLLKSEMNLIRTEIGESVPHLKQHSIQAVSFGFLMGIGLLPLIAFAVIGLGELLDQRYWLSSLIVAILCLGVGGFFSLRAIRKIKAEDLTFKQSRESFDRIGKTLTENIRLVKDSTLGGGAL